MFDMSNTPLGIKLSCQQKKLCVLKNKKNGQLVLYILLPSSLGMNSSMFANCLVYCDVQHVRSLVFGQNVMFRSVRSSVLLLWDQTSL